MKFKKFVMRFSAAFTVCILLMSAAVPAFASEVADGYTWAEVDLDAIRSYHTVAITMDLGDDTYALPSSGSWSAVLVTVTADKMVSNSKKIGWNIKFNDDGSFRLYQPNSEKVLCHRNSNTPVLSVDFSNYPHDWFIDNGYLAINGQSLHYMVIRSGTWDDLASTTAVTYGVSNLRFWYCLEERSYMDVVAGAISTLIGWFGIIVTSLTSTNGALAPVLPFFMVAVSIPVIIVCVKVIKEFTWGQ